MFRQVDQIVIGMFLAGCFLLGSAGGGVGRAQADGQILFEPKFVMALARDASGNLWVGTEDQGVWRIDSSGKQTQFATKDGLGDDHIYALAVDQQGRVWAGHLNHGVSVYNGEKWQNYEVAANRVGTKGGSLAGPLGERVFDIAVCPRDGDVWMATNVGLSRYSVKNGTWTYYTRADGLPSDQIETIAFDPNGVLYTGTQCVGLVISHPTREGEYKKWRAFPSRFTNEPPQTPTGEGLPSNLISDILIGREGKIWIATDQGLAWSDDHGRRFRFVRGQDWIDKLKNLYRPPSVDWDRVKANVSQQDLTLMSEDYVACLGQDSAGRIWIGHWRGGFDVLDTQTGQIFTASRPLLDQTTVIKIKGKEVPQRSTERDDITAILPIAGEVPLLGTYGGGLVRPPEQFKSAADSSDPARSKPTPTSSVPLPSGAKPPSLDTLGTMLEEVGEVRAVPQSPLAIPIADDWRTKGDWLGRYGRYWACLLAMCSSPHDYLWGAGEKPVYYGVGIGPHHRKGDMLRYWVHCLYTANPNALEMPPTYLDSRIIKGYTTPARCRRAASCDDHAEEYPSTAEGPNLWIKLEVPKGVHRLSLYFFNNDGHGASSRLRDYIINVKAYVADLDRARAARPLAISRVHNFWGAVYKRFLVSGPRTYWIEIDKNYGLNTTFSGLFLDTLDPTPQPYFASQSDDAGAHDAQGNTAERLLAAVEQRRLDNLRWWAIHAGRYYAALLRHDMSLSDTAQRKHLRQIGLCQYRLDLYAQWETTQKARGLRTARDIEHSLKWDRKSWSNSGRERQILADYLRRHPAARAEASANKEGS